jgi:hypothetical protein
VLHPYTRGIDAPRTIAELTERTVEVGKKMLEANSDSAALGDATRLPDNLLSLLFRNERALLALSRDPQSAILHTKGYDIALHYNGEPVLRPGIEKVIGVSVKKNDMPVSASVAIRVPAGWRVQPARELVGQQRFTLYADEVADRNTIEVTATLDGTLLNATFAMLGPGEARGYPAGQNVPTCPRCHARVEACICEK